MLIIDSTHQIL